MKWIVITLGQRMSNNIDQKQNNEKIFWWTGSLKYDNNRQDFMFFYKISMTEMRRIVITLGQRMSNNIDQKQNNEKIFWWTGSLKYDNNRQDFMFFYKISMTEMRRKEVFFSLTLYGM